MRKRTQSSVRAVTRDDVARHVPLRPTAFAVLAALAESPRPGIDVLDQVNATVAGRPILGPGTLYRLLRDLRRSGLLTHTETAAGVDDDRQSYHALTPLGAAVLRAELDRLGRTIMLAKSLPARSR